MYASKFRKARSVFSKRVDLKKGISLQKNQAVDLYALNDHNPLNSIHIGLGWDVHDRIQADLDAFIKKTKKNTPTSTSGG